MHLIVSYQGMRGYQEQTIDRLITRSAAKQTAFGDPPEEVGSISRTRRS
jgi:hypothetical protein